MGRKILNLNKVEKKWLTRIPLIIIIQGEGRARHDAGLENADVEGNGDSSKAKRDEVVTPRPIIGILSQVNQK